MNHGLLTIGLKISLENIGRRFNRDWIFRGLSYVFDDHQSYGILGPNGSGKSTLLQILTGSLSPSAGKINYSLNGGPVDAESVYKHLSFAAPYQELIEEFTLDEMIDFHFRFKKYGPGLDKQAITELLGLHSSRHKPIRYFSSGMKQRTKLALAFCADTPMLMLDEPTSNLDNQGIDWYLSLAGQFTANRLTIICSNQQHEYGFCNQLVNIADYKS
ncbi:ABC transporter ATP-binding protein [Mucilaginibacter paludis]|uniref:ABC transporter related protein n=1 Tax=Mucilaginibacter paludis DSM 18603 TaxID=714943 RepID=H1Y6R9_9SPHI|nr:ABC transporter ATP-binding protein [Mucilaginibacter paludis]EHQ26861.1 ABC transporter related protein [Mucilaginibacter paludis DSM 18603]